MNRWGAVAAVLALVVTGCEPPQQTQSSEAKPAPAPKPAVSAVAAKPAKDKPAPMVAPVPLWAGGETKREVDAASATLHGHIVLDLGEAWTPYLFTEGNDADGNLLTNAYRQTYLSLARQEWPKDHHGERAEDDKYLELYGILPTLSVLRERIHAVDNLACRSELDLEPLRSFSGLVTYRSNDTAKKKARDFIWYRNHVRKILRKQGVEDIEDLNVELLEDKDKGAVRRYKRVAPPWFAVEATQARLKCEGYYKTRGRYVRGAMDWSTHDALAEFERRHRIYSWGYLGRDTLKVLRMAPMEAEREALLRVLTERAVHAAGIIEDGSSVNSKGEPRTFLGADGERHPVPNLVADVRARIVEAFGLQTPERAMAFLDTLGELTAGEHRLVAIEGPQLPEYYDGDMVLTLEYDRGDVWYDFPYSGEGKELAQPVTRRPRVTLYTRYNEKRVTLARFGTTIGGWRSEFIDESVMWKYKGSPVGPRVWKRIVAAPVWLPPESTPPRDMLKRKSKRKKGDPEFEVNYHETGPSYASAYGLVAAYHRKYQKGKDGAILVGGDEGIRTHGSVDYMSIMRRHSHGCHRLHNHIAVRMMSFVLAHRPHKRIGQQPVAFKRELVHDEQTYQLDIKRGGYIYELDTPLHVKILEGRIRGKLEDPLELAVPKFDDEIGRYMTSDGRAVELQGRELVDVPLPADAGLPMFDDPAFTDALAPAPL